MELKPLHYHQDAGNRFTVFLAGSIEMGSSEDWQEYVTSQFKEDDAICFFNPRRDAWDASWKQEKTNPEFAAQVNWELDGLEQADLVVFYFSPGTRSPVSMLESGLFAKTGKSVVCCPEGFWRKGNIDSVCDRYKVEQVKDLNELILTVRKRSKVKLQ